MNIKEVKIMTYVILNDRPDANTKEEIAKALNEQHCMELLTKRYPSYVNTLTAENIIDVREYEIRGTRSPNDE